MQPASRYPLLCAALAYYCAAHCPQRAAGRTPPTPEIVLANAQSGAAMGLGSLAHRDLDAADSWLAVPANFCTFVRKCSRAESDYWGGEHATWAEAIATCLAIADIS